MELNQRHEQVQRRMGGLALEIEKSHSKVTEMARQRQLQAQESLHNYF